MSHAHARPRRGFILAEALIALLFLGVVFLALEGTLTLVLRSIADSERQTIAAGLAETHREHASGARVQLRQTAIQRTPLQWIGLRRPQGISSA